jgi:hypothetical protein
MADGSGYATPTVCSSQQSCLDGACVEHECVPSDDFCSGKKVMKCADNGLSSAEVTTCTATQYCDANSATCKNGVCNPNQPTCDGNKATTCNPDGSGYTGGSTACTASQTCDVGVCVPHVCKPSSGFCQGQDVKRCAANGLSSSVDTTCQNAACVATGDDAACQGECVPSSKRCNGNAVQTCSSVGQWLASQACAGATPECNGAGVCTERTNLLTQTEAFELAPWANGGLQAFVGSGSQIDTTASSAPNGTTTAELLREDTSTGLHGLQREITLDPTQTYTFSVYVKSAGIAGVELNLSVPNGVGELSLRINLASGALQSASAGGNGTLVTHSLEALANGWYRVSVSGKPSATAGTKISAYILMMANPAGTDGYAGSGTAALLVWGAQLEKGAITTSYRPN